MASDVALRAPGGSPFATLRELILPLGIVASVLVIVVPLPVPLMDVLLASNITISVIMLLTTVYVKTPLEFNIFPSLLLTTTLFRLVLNVATTRLILTRGESAGLLAAGGVVRSFGEFVAGDKIVVGMIIFVIIVIIQFVVITKGATRISEVAARFALDGMPGRQMAIDADLNAGTIDEREAQRRREEITAQADFFGAMDGASKFVRGDAIAGICIALVNIVGGLFVGVVVAGMPLGDAAALFTKLTIGDGLVSQIPAFLISVAAALLVTWTNKRAVTCRASFSASCSPGPKPWPWRRIPRRSLIDEPAQGPPGVDCRFLHRLGVKAFASDCPAACGQPGQAEGREGREAGGADRGLPGGRPDGGRDRRRPDQAGRSEAGGDLLERIHRIRQNVASEIGIILPKLRIRDSFQLDQQQYRIKIAGLPVASGTVHPGMFLAMDSGMTSGTVPGLATNDPAFGTPALWIEPPVRQQAEMLGYTVVEPCAVIATHLTETVRRHAAEILTRDATKHLIDELRQTAPAVVDELIPAQMKLAEVQQILQSLLREQVPIRRLSAILETLGDYAGRTKDRVVLAEYVRARLARTISTRYRDRDNRLHVVTLDPALEDRIRAGVEHSERGLLLRMSPQAVETTCRRIADGLERLGLDRHPPIVLCSPQVRAAVKELAGAHLPELIVLSYNEITRDTQIESVAMVTDAV